MIDGKEKEAAVDMLMKRENNKLYTGAAKAYPEISEALRAEKITASVAQHRALLQRFEDRVDLRDFNAVKATADAYLATCEASATIPTFLGLAAALGHSRSGVYAWCSRNYDSDTAKYIDAFRSTSAAIIAQGSLTRSLDCATSIFLLKNSGQELSDRQDLTLYNGHEYEERRPSAEEIRKRYEAIGGLPD